jgi:uncharacterized Zn-finger protein
VRVHPMRPTLTVPGSKRLKLKCDELPSSFAFNFDLRRHTKEHITESILTLACPRCKQAFVVGRCRLTLSNPL